MRAGGVREHLGGPIFAPSHPLYFIQQFLHALLAGSVLASILEAPSPGWPVSSVM